MRPHTEKVKKTQQFSEIGELALPASTKVMDPFIRLFCARISSFSRRARCAVRASICKIEKSLQCISDFSAVGSSLFEVIARKIIHIIYLLTCNLSEIQHLILWSSDFFT